MPQNRPTPVEQNTHPQRNRQGQALVEYALILVFVVMGLVTVLTLTKDAIGNVFSNQVYNLVQDAGTPYPTELQSTFDSYLTAVASYTPPARVFKTNAP